MLPIENFNYYVKLNDTNPCYKNGNVHKTGNTVELTVQLTNICNAHCDFCANNKFCNNGYIFDFEKFKIVFETIKANYPIVKVGITGGEPTLHKDFVDFVHYIRRELPETNIVVNTNGSNINKLEQITDCDVEFGISIHHFIDENNRAIFNNQELNMLNIVGFSQKQNVLVHCNLIKGQIDNIDKCKHFLDSMIVYGFPEVGFVELMPYTQDAIEKRVQVNLFDLPDIKITRFAERKGVCHCANVIYKDKIKVYMREMDCTDCSCLVSSPFVYNNNKLSFGFSGPVIWDMNNIY